jgi:hypothetical protein
MATTLTVDPSAPFALSRHFFIAWQHRNASRQARWSEALTDPKGVATTATSQLRFDSLQDKIQHLKSEIVSSPQRTQYVYHASRPTYLRSSPQRDAIWCCESNLFCNNPNVLVEWLTLLYSGGPWFKYRPGDQLSCLSFS